ncbi:MAG TPA: pyridoxal-dependent decarboxylase, partial [Blastocatellia bacterium]|nr:pyridoxal-dependent decarboxylase [Blastocatellia bacterium]
PPKFYVSRECHVAWFKIAHQAGIGRSAVSMIATDGTGRMDLAALRAAIRADLERGCVPVMLVATAGTTNAGMIDPLQSCAAVALEFGLFYHVDAAWGGALIASDELRGALAGIERADSLSLDPHKWLFQPFEIGCVLLRDARILKKTFRAMAGILEDTKRAEEEEINYYDYGVQLTRGFRALKLWLSFKTFGAAAFREAINRGFEMAEFAEGVLRQSDRWRICAPATMGIVTFRYAAEGCSEDEINEIHRRMVEMMSEDGFAFANSTALRGQTVMRLCTINPRATEEDVRATIDQLEQFGRELQDRIKNR